MKQLRNANKDMLIDVKDLVKKYGKRTILKDISLSISRGERVAFVAANGTGKSTLMEIIGGIRPNTSGKVYLKNDIKLGFQFQESRYPFGVTVKSMVKFYLDIYNIKISKKELDKQLEFFQLKDLYKQQIIMLSGGQQQRVNLFLALCSNPDIWFLDEISTGLDIKFKSIILSYIDSLINPQKTLLLVSHDSQEIDHLCNRIIVLDQSIMICDLSRDQIIKVFKSVSDFIDYFFHILDGKKAIEKKQLIADYIAGKKKFIKKDVKKYSKDNLLDSSQAKNENVDVIDKPVVKKSTKRKSSGSINTKKVKVNQTRKIKK